MNALHSVMHLRPSGMDEREWTLRLELAACYRLFDWLGWAEMIFNHITVRVPGSPESSPHYLINPYGLHYTEVSARNLVKIDTEGNKVDGSPHEVNPAGFVIHSAIHRVRHDAQCIMHTHTTAGMAVACKAEGLRHDNFYSAMMYGRVAYHDFEGITTDLAEQERLVASLGERDVLILRNHGLLVTGPHVPGAFRTMWNLQRACEVQVASDSMRGDNVAVPREVLERIPEQRKPLLATQQRAGELMFDAILRRAGIAWADLV